MQALELFILEERFNAAVAAKVQRTLTAKQAERIEFEAQAKIKGLISELSDEALNTGRALQDLKLTHGDEVSKTIRKIVHDSYMTGAEYVGRTVGEDVIYPSTKNVKRIGEISDDVESYFWRQLDLQIKAGETKRFVAQNLTEDQLDDYVSANPLMSWYSDLTAGLLIANLAVYPTVADGTIDKIGELKPNNPKFQFQDWIVRWKTMEDPNVCPICEDLDGEEYDFNDPMIPYPRYDTHPNCRCILELVVEDNEAVYPLGPEGYLYDTGFVDPFGGVDDLI